jgi:hypothetical protein
MTERKEERIMTSQNKTRAAVRMTRLQAGLFRRFREESGKPGLVAVTDGSIILEPFGAIFGGGNVRWDHSDSLAQWIKSSFQPAREDLWATLTIELYRATERFRTRAYELLQKIPTVKMRRRLEKLLHGGWGDIPYVRGYKNHFAMLRAFTRGFLTLPECKELDRALGKVRDYADYTCGSDFPFELYDLSVPRAA